MSHKYKPLTIPDLSTVLIPGKKYRVLPVREFYLPLRRFEHQETEEYLRIERTGSISGSTMSSGGTTKEKKYYPVLEITWKIVDRKEEEKEEEEEEEEDSGMSYSWVGTSEEFRSGLSDDGNEVNIFAAPKKTYTYDGEKVLACATRFKTWDPACFIGVYHIIEEDENQARERREKAKKAKREEKKTRACKKRKS
jgi:hypothetical protein